MKLKKTIHSIRISEEDWQRWKIAAEKDRRSVADWASVTLTRLLEDQAVKLEEAKTARASSATG